MPTSDLGAKVLNSTEDAHIKDMSTFETEEHLRVTDAASTCSGMVRRWAAQQRPTQSTLARAPCRLRPAKPERGNRNSRVVCPSR